MPQHQIITSGRVFAVLSTLSLLVGLAIFVFVDRGIIRIYGGDVVTIIFLYSTLRLLPRLTPAITTVMVLSVAIGLEVLQATVSLPRSPVAALTLGSTFDPKDIVIYLITTLAIFLLDRLFLSRLKRSTSI